jgi:tetratricopeptide (TPR) repeat protein
MNTDDNGFLSYEEFEQLITRYEALREGSSKNGYFDVIELEGLLDYHLEINSMEDISLLLQLADKQHPNATSIDIRRAKYLFSDGRFTEAYTLLDKLERLEPSNHEVYLIKGLIQIVDKRLKDANVSFRKCIDLADDDIDEIYYTIAVALESARQYKEAMRYFKKAWQTSPTKDVELLYDLAYCSEKAGYYEDSVRYYQEFLDSNPFHEPAWYNLGVSFHSLEKFQNAIEAFDYALTIEPEYLLALHGKADALVQIEQYEEAIKYYEKAMKYGEEDAEGLCEIGECYRMLYHPDKALEFFNKSLELDARYPDAHYGIGMIKYEDEKYMESLIFLRKAIDIAPYNPDYYYALGVSLLEVGILDEAAEAFERAVKLYPYDPDFWLSFADLSYVSGNEKEAIDLLQKANEINKKSARIKYRLAAYYFNLEKKSEGLDCLEEAVKLDKFAIDDFLDYYDLNFHDDVKEMLIQF